MANDIDKAMNDIEVGLGVQEAPAQKAARKKLEARQAKELGLLDEQKKKRTASRTRKQRGRASLISGAETGLSDTLG